MKYHVHGDHRAHRIPQARWRSPLGVLTVSRLPQRVYARPRIHRGCLLGHSLLQSDRGPTTLLTAREGCSPIQTSAVHCDMSRPRSARTSLRSRGGRAWDECVGRHRRVFGLWCGMGRSETWEECCVFLARTSVVVDPRRTAIRPGALVGEHTGDAHAIPGLGVGGCVGLGAPGPHNRVALAVPTLRAVRAGCPRQPDPAIPRWCLRQTRPDGLSRPRVTNAVHGPLRHQL